MVFKRAQVALGVRVEPSVHQLGDDGALDLEGAGRQVHQAVQALIKVRFIAGQVGDAGQVHGDDTHRTGGFAGTEEAAGLLAQFTQVQTEPAAHGADVGGLHIGIDIVGEIRRAVLGGHFKEELVVLRLAPVKIPGDGVGRDRVLEAAAVGVALNHDLDEGLVDHVHLFFAVAVGEGHFLAADDGRLVFQVLGAGPVQGDVGKRRLRAPAGGRVDPVDEGLDALLDFLLGEVVRLDKGSQIGIEGGERLGPGPFVLHDA